jgi:hypothetical protein
MDPFKALISKCRTSYFLDNLRYVPYLVESRPISAGEQLTLIATQTARAGAVLSNT